MPDETRPERNPRPVLLAVLALLVAALAFRRAFPAIANLLPDLRPKAEIRIEDQIAWPGDILRIEVRLRPLGSGGVPFAEHQFMLAANDRPVTLPLTDDAGLAVGTWAAPDEPGVYPLLVRLHPHEGFQETQASACVAVVSPERPLVIVDSPLFFGALTTERLLMQGLEPVDPGLLAALQVVAENHTIAYLRPPDAPHEFSLKFARWRRRWSLPEGPAFGSIPKGSLAEAEKAWRNQILALARPRTRSRLVAAVLTPQRKEAWFLASNGVRVLYCGRGAPPPGAESVPRFEDIPGCLRPRNGPGATGPEDARIPPSGRPDERP